LKKSDPVLVSFGTNIPDATAHQMPVQFFTSPIVSFCATWGNKKEQNIAFLTTLVLLLKQNNTQNTHFVHDFIILANSLSNCPFLAAYKSLKCWLTNMGSARRHFLYSLIAALIMFCFRPIQTSPVTS